MPEQESVAAPAADSCGQQRPSPLAGVPIHSGPKVDLKRVSRFRLAFSALYRTRAGIALPTVKSPGSWGRMHCPSMLRLAGRKINDITACTQALEPECLYR